MANININEISQNYTYNIGASSYATVALPITACWGPGYVDPATLGSEMTRDDVLETIAWQRFNATQAGLEAFVAAYRGPSSNYRIANDYSYHMAMSLLTAGYDVLVCRLCPGAVAEGTFKTITVNDKTVTEKENGGSLTVKAKYPGTFGNNLMVSLTKAHNANYYNFITYVIDGSGVRTAVENLTFVFDLDDSTDSILHISEIESNFVTFSVSGTIDKDDKFGVTSDSKLVESAVLMLSDGSDRAADKGTASAALTEAKTLATVRYASVTSEDEAKDAQYIKQYDTLIAGATNFDLTKANMLAYKEWLYTNAYFVYDLLKDKLSYSPQRIITPGWDDQNISDLTGEVFTGRLSQVSPLHVKLLDVGYYSRCGTSLLDVPKCLPRSKVYNESSNDNEVGYAQLLARYVPSTAGGNDVNAVLYSSNSALQAPWGTYTYVGTTKKNIAPPSFLMLLIQRAMILHQASQYEWALPTNRKHSVDIGKLDYAISKKQLDEWQKQEGVGVNIITTVPELGTTLWGNSTLYEVAPATYQALANLSTRYLVNALKDLVYRVGIQITFQYNNSQAYSSFYAGVTPLLDTMKNVGAIDDYVVKMSADINGLDQTNANTLVGKIYLTINGVVNDISVDLIALPPSVDLAQFNS